MTGRVLVSSTELNDIKSVQANRMTQSLSHQEIYWIVESKPQAFHNSQLEKLNVHLMRHKGTLTMDYVVSNMMGTV